MALPPGDAAIVEELLAYGVDVNRAGELKNTPLHLACTNHHEEIAAVLLMRGASATARNQYGIGPYGVATKQAVKDVGRVACRFERRPLVSPVRVNQ